ncbi:MAG: hypothetical protein ACFHXK_03490 [bacterium]
MKEEPKISSRQAYELIQAVKESDRERARAPIADGVQSARDQWIEAPLIAEALTLELIAVAENSHANHKIAAYLRELADVLDAQPDCH